MKDRWAFNQHRRSRHVSAASSHSFDCAGSDALVAAVFAASYIESFDINSDGMLTILDIETWLTVAGAANLSNANPYLMGEATLDGVVDGLDFIVWSDHKFTAEFAWCRGNFNADRLDDGLDFSIWNQHKFSSSDRLDTPALASDRWSIDRRVQFTALPSWRQEDYELDILRPADLRRYNSGSVGQP